MAVRRVCRRGAASMFALIGMVGVLGASPAVAPVRAEAATSSSLWFDDAAHSALRVSDGGYVDGYGREVTLRGFNVSGEAKLAEDRR